MKNISTAIIAVMKTVKGMEKNSKVGGDSKHSYNGTKDQDVKEVFNEALANNGLCMIPQDIEESTQIDRWEEVDQWSKTTPKEVKQKQSIFTKVKVKYLLLHTSGESLIVCGYGHGVDSQDKGAGKATTYAMKNALLYTFMTPVGKIDDAETTHSEEIKVPQPKVEPKTTTKQKVNLLATKVDDVNKALKEGKTTKDFLEANYFISKDVMDLLIFPK